MKMKDKQFHFEGQGYGHGVGLCQLGALELAKRGYDYRQILAFYFPRHKIATAYRP
jgi:stage II sporulation protein D